MIELWEAMGFIRYPLTMSSVIIVALVLYSTVRLFEGDARPLPMTKTFMDSVLFWGGFSLITGILGTLVGIVVAAQSIERAGTVAPTLVWGGIKVALYSSVFGLLVLAVSSLAWFVLHLRWRFLSSREVM
ncbi:MAG: hypothetical protein HKO77_08650, partial [Gemmatimonadetes bacterium]|nr:hypothetical protein [Gemmatimonadota bacterium]